MNQSIFQFGDTLLDNSLQYNENTWGTLQRGPGENFGRVGRNAFGPTKYWPVCSLILAVVN